MQKSNLITIISALLIVSFSPYTCLAYSGGSGTAGNPYQIANVADFQQLSTSPSDWNKYFILTANIDLTGLTFTNSPIAPDGIIDYDFQGTKFTGVFDGNGHVISNLTINASGQYYIGLFGYVNSGQIRNLGIENINVTGRYYVGGLVGWNHEGTITDCYSTGSVGNGFGIGGLVGYNTPGSLTACYSTCQVSGEHVGGLVGINSGSLTTCFAAGSVTSYTQVSKVGGLIGFNYGGSAISCYATGAVSGNQYVGGLTGQNWGSIITCYSTGKVIGNQYVGGLVGDGGSATNSFWDTQTSGQNYSSSGKPRTTAEMKQMANYFGWNSDGHIVWNINEGIDYPRLIWEGMYGVTMPSSSIKDTISGKGTTSAPYLIYTDQQFNTIGLYPYEWGKCYKLMADIDLSAYTWDKYNVIGSSEPFTGIFNGNGHIISNVTCCLFGTLLHDGYLPYQGQIRNLGLINVNVTNGSALLGTNNSGLVTSCYVSGSVTGTSENVGGLAAWNYQGTITNCYVSGSVTGTSHVGGLVGSNSHYSISATITDCYSTASVSGTSEVGGLAGENTGVLTASFWDTQVSGKIVGVGSGDSTGVTGKTTGEMMTKVTFTSAGWKFPSVWTIDEGIDYPKLAWQSTPILTTGKFGSLSGKKAVKLTLKDIQGVDVTFSLTGGGYGQVDPCDSTFSTITLYDTTDKSTFTITTKGKTETSVGSIIVNGSLKSISAKTTNLRGNISVTGSLATLTLNDVADDHTISIGSPTIPNPKASVTMVFDRVADLTIDSPIPIKSLTATEWLVGSINAPSIGSITTKGDKKRAIAGDLDVNVAIDSNINSVKVAGALSGDWTCNSVKSISATDVAEANLKLNQQPDVKVKVLALGNLTIKGWIDSTQIRSRGHIGMVTAGAIVDSNCFAGVAEGITGLPEAEAASFSGTATIKSIAVKGIKGVKKPYYINSNIAAVNILSASIAYPQSDNGGVPFGLTADNIKKLTIKNMDGTTLKNPKSTWTLDNLEIRLY